jgi:hemoglobin-like flavoprotein
MNVKDTIRRNILLFPSSYQNVIDVLDQSLLTCGTGEKWVNGEIVDTTNYCDIFNEYPANKVPTIDEAINHAEQHRDEQLQKMKKLYSKLLPEDKVKEALDNYTDRWQKQELAIIKDIANRETDKSLDYSLRRWKERHEKLKMQDELYIFRPEVDSNICLIPKNVKKDWLEACEFLCDVMINNEELVYPEGRNLLNKIKNHINSIKYGK